MKTIRMAGTFLATSILVLGLAGCGQQNGEQVSSASPDQNPSMSTDSAPASINPPASDTMQPAETPATNPVPVTTHSPSHPKSAKPATSAKHSTPKTVAAVPASETRTVSLPAGAAFDIQLTTPINTASNKVGDPVEGTLLESLQTTDGVEIAAKGAVIHGEISELKAASKSHSEEDRASVKLAFTSIETVDGEKSLNATVTNVDAMKAGSTTKRDALVIGGSAVAGAVLGKVLGHNTEGAAIGAVGGAVAGTGAVLAMKGHELEIPAGSKVSLRAEQPITVAEK
jgi:hypothetical protein